MTHGKSTGGAKLSANVPSLDGAITNQISSYDGVPKVLGRRMFARAALGAIVLNETLGNASIGFADDRTVTAKVVSVDADKATITVADATYNVHAKAQIKVNGKRGKLADVEPGLEVKLTFNSARSPVRMVSAIEATGTREEPGTADLPKGPVQTVPEGGTAMAAKSLYSAVALCRIQLLLDRARDTDVRFGFMAGFNGRRCILKNWKMDRSQTAFSSDRMYRSQRATCCGMGRRASHSCL